MAGNTSIPFVIYDRTITEVHFGEARALRGFPFAITRMRIWICDLVHAQ
jgi:hypothetical protein